MFENSPFTCSASLAPSADEIRESMRVFLRKFGPPRCLVILPDGSFFSGTLEEMRDLLLVRAANGESRTGSQPANIRKGEQHA